jgi:ABC-2 type transport system permease protein
MMRVIRCELTRLRSPGFILGGIGLMALFGVLATTVVFLTASSGSTALPGTEGVSVAMLEAPDGMFAGLRTFLSMLGIVALVIWATAVTSDYANGLIRLLVQAEPSRWRLLGGKVVALTVFTCVATLATTAVVLPLAPGIASLVGVSTDAWSADMLRTVLEGYLQLTLSVLLWGMVGLFVGMVTRSSGISIAIGIGYLMVFEGLAGMLLDSAGKWLPGSAFSAIASGGTAGMAFTTAILVSAAYALGAIAIAAVTFQRRDITA